MGERTTLDTELKGKSLVGYVPFDDEPDYRRFLLTHALPSAHFVIPASKDILPEVIEGTLKQEFSHDEVALFIPGRQFDATGTRHGRGRGWYDRLLAGLPERWIRIGVSGREHFSEMELVRKSWDQPVDYVLIEGENGFSVLETGARRGVLE